MRLQFEDAGDAANVAEVAIVGATTVTSAEFNAMGVHSQEETGSCRWRN